MTDTALAVAREQLRRMRGMTGMYHRRFFADIWLTVITYLAVLATGYLGSDSMFVALAFIALFGAVITAFDASYLIFARHYSRYLERYINQRLGENILVGGRLEDAYLFPLNSRKVVTIALGSGFSWFGFMTAFFTGMGIAGYAFGLFLAVRAFESGYGILAYAATIALLTAAALGAGTWWFVAGTGEARLEAVLRQSFGEDAKASSDR
jgi:hypothetical protein